MTTVNDSGPALPSLMTAAVLRGPGDLRLERMDVPRPGPGEMLVRIKACGICGSDLMDWYVQQKAPFVFGHEPTGDVVALGEGVNSFRAGQRVILHHHAPCGQCPACRRGDDVHCSVWRKQALLPGGMAEFAVVAEQSVLRDTHLLPEDASYEAGTLVEPTACVVKALRRAGFAAGMNVLIVGLGFTGQLFGFVARAQGAARIAGSDFIAPRLALAQRSWADETYDVGQKPPPTGQWDMVAVTAGSAAAMMAGLEAVRNGGTLLLFAPSSPGRPVPFPVDELLFREVTVVTSYSAAPADIREALGYVFDGTIPADELITHRIPLQEAERAYRTAQDVQRALKVVVTMD